MYADEPLTINSVNVDSHRVSSKIDLQIGRAIYISPFNKNVVIELQCLSMLNSIVL